MKLNQATPYLWALAVLALLWIIYGLWARSWNPLRIVVGADRRPSTSKLQWFLWTVVVIFSYVAIYAARAEKGYFAAIDEIPGNLLIAMGLSIGTMVVAKAITTSYVSSGQLNKAPYPSPLNPQPPPAPPAPGAAALTAPPPTGATKLQQSVGFGAVLQDDDGTPDPSKIQMLAWTFITIGIYLYTLFHVVPEILKPLPPDAMIPGLPNIDAALMVLMGLGQGAYLGKKLVTTDTPRLTGLTPSSGHITDQVAISGLSFGEGQNGNAITIDGAPNIEPALEWHEAQIKFKIPAQHPNGTPILPGQKLDIGLMVNGQESANRLPLTVQ